MEQEIAVKLQGNNISYGAQFKIPIATVDFFFQTGPRPLIVFIDGPVHLKITQMMKTRSCEPCFEREDTNCWSYRTPATQTRKETNYAKKSQQLGKAGAETSWMNF